MRNKKAENESLIKDEKIMRRQKIVGNIIRSKRKSLRLSIENLAETLDISTSYLGLLERGNRAPSFELINTISERLDMPFSQLLGEGTVDAVKDKSKSKSAEDETLYLFMKKLNVEQKRMLIKVLDVILFDRGKGKS